jgi:hypothetical protein
LTTLEGCKAEALERGLTWDAPNQDFAGEWEVDGCFMYEASYADGYYNGRAYFGTGGDSASKTQDLCSPHIRLDVCGEQRQVPCAVD